VKKKIDQFEIIGGRSNTAAFIEEVQTAADTHRDALGFLPKSVFEEFARRDQLYILTEKYPEGSRYAGHLMFDRRFPRANVVQMFILQKYRRCGLATKLINHLCIALTQDGFTSIYARVAEDLIDANAFWGRQQFYVQRVVKGGATRNRQILVRCHELASPQLFPTSGINEHNPLGLMTPSSDVIPLFLLDLNVIFDLAPRRLRNDVALSLFQSERMDFYRLAVSNEAREELRRTAQPGKTDPMESVISIFPSFPLFQNKDSGTLLDELASLIFSEKHEKTQLKANDRSDLRHVATAIQHDLAGLITNDKKILTAAPQIKEKYGVEVVSPDAFKFDGMATPNKSAFETSGGSTLALKEVSEPDKAALHALLSKLKLSGSAIAAGWLPAETQGGIAARCAVWNHSAPIGYLTWSARGAADITTARVAVDETEPQSLNAARVLLTYLLEKLALDGPRQVNLEFPQNQSYLRELAIGFGFRGTPSQHCLSKIVLGGVLTCATWAIQQQKLAKNGGLKLPASIPTYRSNNQQIQILTPDGNQTHLTLDVLESLLSPALFCLPNRPAVITPVQRRFSEPLFGHSPQGSLLPLGTASLFQDRHYISAPRNLRHFKRGNLILFYESTRHGGRSAIIAIARVRQAYLKHSDALALTDFEQSVVTPSSLTRIGKSKMKTVTVFDNIFPLPQPVPLKSLQRLGCGSPNNLICTQSVTDAQLQEILEEAFNHG